MPSRNVDRSHSDWSHRTVLTCRPPSALAAASARHYLLEHRRFDLVDTARMVAIRLASDPVLCTDAPLILTLSEADTVVRLTVHDSSAPWGTAQTSILRGSTEIGLTALRWGVRWEADAITGLWATLDARGTSQALLDARDAMTFGLNLNTQARSSA